MSAVKLRVWAVHFQALVGFGGLGSALQALRASKQDITSISIVFAYLYGLDLGFSQFGKP
jgi:hypothetical protein